MLAQTLGAFRSEPDFNDDKVPNVTEPSAREVDREQLARAVGSLIWKNPERILEVFSRLRGSDTVIECLLRGASMEPAIPRGATVRIKLGRTAPYRVGEVVAFVQDDGICVHRVALLGRGQRARDYLVTQGDACLYPDPPISLPRVLGPVTGFRLDGDWVATTDRASIGRARSFRGRSLLKVVAALMALDIRLAQRVARGLRIRKEHAGQRLSKGTGRG